MSYEKYCNLIDEICDTLRIERNEVRYLRCNLQRGDIYYTLLHGGEQDENSLYIYCDLGELPTEHTTESLQRLLESNIYLFGNSGPTFAINPDTKRPVLMFRMAVSDATVASVMGIMSTFDIQAITWRQTYFLTDEERGVLPEQAAA